MAFMRAMRCERDLYGSRERELQTACWQVDSSEVYEGEQEEGRRRVYKERKRKPIEVLSCSLHHAIKPSSNDSNQTTSSKPLQLFFKHQSSQSKWVAAVNALTPTATAAPATATAKVSDAICLRGIGVARGSCHHTDKTSSQQP